MIELTEMINWLPQILFIFVLFGIVWITPADDSDYPAASWIKDLQDDKQDIDGAIALTGTDQWDKGANIPSAGTLVPGADGNYFHVTGTTGITAINATQSQPGTVICLVFDGILILTHHATDLILPSGANITTAAGDRAIFAEESANKWRCVVYQRADGTPLVGTPNALLKDGTVAATGTLQWDKGGDVASANTLAPGADGNYFDVTGITAILAINAAQSQPGTIICLHFDGILVLTHHATDLILPGGANITTAAGDEAIFVEYAADDWRCVCYIKASGLPIINP